MGLSGPFPSFSRCIPVFCRPMGLSGLEPPTSRLSGVRSNRLSYKPGYVSYSFLRRYFLCYGDGEIRTLDPLLARQVLSQLSYAPVVLSSFISQSLTASLSFLIRQPPALPHRLQCSTIGRLSLNLRVRDGNGCVP